MSAINTIEAQRGTSLTTLEILACPRPDFSELSDNELDNDILEEWAGVFKRFTSVSVEFGSYAAMINQSEAGRVMSQVSVPLNRDTFGLMIVRPQGEVRRLVPRGKTLKEIVIPTRLQVPTAENIVAVSSPFWANAGGRDRLWLWADQKGAMVDGFVNRSTLNVFNSVLDLAENQRNINIVS